MTSDIDRISAIGRVAILTNASEEQHDGYVEVTTADARALLDERRDLAEKLSVATRTVATLAAQLRMQETGDRAEELLAESRVHWPKGPGQGYETICGDTRGRSTMFAEAITCPACRAWMSGDDESAAGR